MVVGLVGATALMFLVAGVAVIAAFGLLRDDQGYFTTGEELLQSGGYAIVTDDLDLGFDDAGIEAGDFAASLQLEVESTGAEPVFVGIGPSADVDRYLGRVARSRLEDFSNRGRPRFTQFGGGPPRTAPGRQQFWAARSEGAGEQRIEWGLDEGTWTAVAMNADGSRPLSVDAEAGFKIDWLLWVGIGLTVISLLIVIASGFGMNRLFRAP